MDLDNITLDEIKQYCKQCMCKMKKTYVFRDTFSDYEYIFEKEKYYPIFIDWPSNEIFMYSFDRECYLGWSIEDAREFICLPEEN